MARYVLSWSGGKDSTLALDRASRQGLDVSCLFNIYDGSSRRVRGCHAGYCVREVRDRVLSSTWGLPREQQDG